MTLFIGLMSGTSMDAVDAALVSHADHPPKLVAHHSHPIPDPIHRVLTSIVAGNYDPRLIWQMDVELGRLFADAVAELLNRAGVTANEVISIGSHGQTIYHGPNDTPPVTIQIADPNIIAERTGITTVADFRRRDLAAGGQGAPLAPAFHNAVFRSRAAARVVVNIGGIANITVLPEAPEIDVIGFDTGPGNTLMDIWCAKHRGKPMDTNGEFAGSGSIIEPLLSAMLADSYFKMTPPKSTGREYFHIDWLHRHLAESGCENCAPEDIQRTLLALTVKGIADAISEYAPATKEVFVCGGGARNNELMDALSQQMEGRAVATTEAAGADPDWIEAIAFSWMAKQTVEGKPASLPSVTGARRSVVLGGVYRA